MTDILAGQPAIIASFVIDNHIPTTPARAWGDPAGAGRLRERPGDFRVDEQLGFEPEGEGPHWLLRVEKTGCNTARVAELLAAHAGVPGREVGYSGLKDRHAVCTQWFSVPVAGAVDWDAFEHEGIRILERARHRRKLKRGAHRGNRFDIRVACDTLDAAALADRAKKIREQGVPNYFGEQRFGRRYADNARRLAAGGRLSRQQRSMTLSAIRAELFNRVLDERVRQGNWNLALSGEYLNLDGTRSGFRGDGDPGVAARVAALDVHPTGPLYGGGPNPAGGQAAALEEAVLAPHEALCRVLVRQGLRLERRATRCRPRELEWALEDDRVLMMRFALRRGEFATMVLRELVDYEDVTRRGDGDGTGDGIRY